MTLTQAYGSWTSTLSAAHLAQKTTRFGHMALDGDSVYWIEMRPHEKGRGVLVRSRKGETLEEVLPPSVSVGSKVHEYGGGDFTVVDGVVYFSSSLDGRVYCFNQGKLKALTPLYAEYEQRFADFCLHPAGHYLLAVRETHFKPGLAPAKTNKVTNELVAISLDQIEVRVLHSGFDFYSFPRFTPAGNRVCWTCWNQPDMPWDNAELWVADFHASANIDAAHRVTGGKGSAVFQPGWSPKGVLHYLSDQSGWANLYTHEKGVLNALTPIDRDFSVPQWVFGLGSYFIHQEHSIYALYFENGQQQLCHIDTETGHIEPLDLPFSCFEASLLGDQDALYFSASGPTISKGIFRYHLASKQWQRLSACPDSLLDPRDLSIAESIWVESGERPCHAFYYPPKNHQFKPPQDEKPPLIVMSHGGPTGFADNSLNWQIQFWTQRGFAVVDVNYAGSFGFGKAYREKLMGNWGLVDVEDCVAVAKELVAKGLADEKRLVIRGGSAGGFTTLCALTFTEVFAAGMSRYGVADLQSLATDSHKFEARYLDKLVGPYPAAKSVYQARSPIFHAAKLSCPILILQGTDDKVVPPNQAEKMVSALQQNSIPYAYLLFEDEGHGFRRAETIEAAFNAELYFYRRVLGVVADEALPAITIENLPGG